MRSTRCRMSDAPRISASHAGSIEVAGKVVEIGQAAFASLEERNEKPLRTRRPLADDRLPQRCDLVTLTLRVPSFGGAGGHDAVSANADRCGEDRKGGRGALVDSPDQRFMVGEELQRLIVQRRQAMAEQRRLAVCEDNVNQL